MNIDLAVVQEALSNLNTGITNVITVFKTFPQVIQDFADAFTSDLWSSSAPEAPAQGE